MSLPIINFGSCCIDHVYAVDHFVNPGETLPCTGYEVHPGGKGLNQSIALARAGAEVLHAGRIGQDGQWLKTLLDDEGVGTELLLIDDGPTGHANIQVSSAGENAIVLFGGANRNINREDIDRVLSQAAPGQLMLLQNEISELDYLVDKAIETGLRLVLNAAPMSDNIKRLPLEQFELLIINEIEGEALAGAAEPREILRNLRAKFPATRLLLTLGEAGAVYQHGDTQVTQEAASVEVKDSTGAGDTFTGYFLANYSRDDSIEHCLRKATLAAGISVTRKGAASSIPEAGELDNAG
ncbi:MAG: ribokinase [Pseudomonadales bacterium]|jgi:ribokinase|nr:ribokinase [Pseudomonadales bacterium]